MADVYLSPGETIPTDVRLRDPLVPVIQLPAAVKTDVWLRTGETNPTDVRLVDPTPTIAD